MWCITFLDLHISNHPYISRMKITWLCRWSFWCVLEYGLQVYIFVEKNLHLCSSRILICNFYLVSSWSFSCKVVLMSFWISLISVVMAHFLFLVLLIWVFSFFWFISLKFCQSRLFCPRASSLFLWFFILFFVFIPLSLALHGFFPLTDFEFGLLTFYKTPRYIVIYLTSFWLF